MTAIPDDLYAELVDEFGDDAQVVAERALSRKSLVIASARPSREAVIQPRPWPTHWHATRRSSRAPTNWWQNDMCQTAWMTG